VAVNVTACPKTGVPLELVTVVLVLAFGVGTGQGQRTHQGDGKAIGLFGLLGLAGLIFQHGQIRHGRGGEGAVISFLRKFLAQGLQKCGGAAQRRLGFSAMAGQE
jgi:hypothetical protein